jgi:hypothetical protein
VARLIVLTSVTLAVAVTAAVAQESHWGVIASITPTTSPPDQFNRLFQGTTVDIQGHEFRIGVARGRDLGGDWGISYYRKRVTEGSGVSDVEEECGRFVNGCFMWGDETVARDDVILNAVEIHKFFSFATIKRRVQVGLQLGGGIGQFSGTVEERYHYPDVLTFDPRAGATVGTQRTDVTVLPAREQLSLFGGAMPVGRLELAVAGVVARGVKIRGSGGIGFPANSTFTLTGVYFFGAR